MVVVAGASAVAGPSLGLRLVPGSQLSLQDEHRDYVWLDLDAPLKPGQAEHATTELIVLAADDA